MLSRSASLVRPTANLRPHKNLRKWRGFIGARSLYSYCTYLECQEACSSALLTAMIQRYNSTAAVLLQRYNTIRNNRFHNSNTVLLVQSKKKIQLLCEAVPWEQACLRRYNKTSRSCTLHVRLQQHQSNYRKKLSLEQQRACVCALHVRVCAV